MRISDWSSDVCSSDLFAGIASQHQAGRVLHAAQALLRNGGVAGSSHFDSPHQWDGDNGWAPAQVMAVRGLQRYGFDAAACDIARRWVDALAAVRSEEHTSELQSLMRISYAVFCLKKKKSTRTLSKHRESLDARHGVIVEIL